MSPSGVRSRLQTALAVAMRNREKSAASALRTALAAIANAEAVPAPETTELASVDTDQPIAGARAGLGAGEADRRLLDEATMVGIVRSEVEELLHTAELYDELGRSEAADELRVRAASLTTCLDGASDISDI